jgi:2-polyprenyl-3-methyl-5-hydroxy-6-metoxy-1,4-benzoquinol methylase
MTDAEEQPRTKRRLSREQQLQEDEYAYPCHYLDLIPQLECALSFPKSYRRWVLELIGPCTGQRVLDAGCGDGRFCYDIRDENLAVTGVDYSERAIGFARGFCPGAVFHVGDLASFRPAEKFDVVVMLEALEHVKLDEVPDVVRNMHACLVENGRLIVTVPSSRIPVSPKHYQHFTRDSLVKTLSSHFDVLEVHGHLRMGFQRWIARRMLNCAVFIKGSLRQRLSVMRLYFRIGFHFLHAIERCRPEEGERLIAVFRKRSDAG